jgi:hypothetical protein
MLMLHLPFIKPQPLPSFLIDDFGNLCQITRPHLETPSFTAAFSLPCVSQDTFRHVYREDGE